MARTENPYMKQYLEEFVIKKLSECELFVDAYGKNFAKKRLALNLEKVFTNERSRSCSGYQKSSDLSITICKAGPNGEILVPEDLSEDDKETLLHEAIHAIFSKTRKECADDEISYGTGIMSRFSNGMEIGRGLNEGLTEWICEKAGFENKSYVTLTNFIKQIELALGEKEVIKFARGCNYEVLMNAKYGRENLAELLDMYSNDMYTYFSIADGVYLTNDMVSKYSIIIDTLERQNKRDMLSEEEIETLDADLELIQKERVYVGLSENLEYADYLQEHDLEDSNLSKIEFLKSMRKRAKLESIESRIDFESMTFEHYFIKEFEELKLKEEITEEEFEKFYKLKTLMQQPNEYTKGKEDKASLKFLFEFKEIQRKFKESLIKRFENDIKTKNMNPEKFNRYTELLKMASLNGEYVEMLKVFESTDVKNPDATLYLINYLQQCGKLNEIAKYEIVEFGNTNQDNSQKTIIYFKDGNPDAEMSYGIKSFSEQDEVDYEEVFDFTLEMEEDVTTIIQEFLKLKEKLVSEDPYVTFSILNREIIVNSKGETSYYKIEHGEMTPIEETGRDTVDFFSDKLEKNAQLMQLRKKESFIKKFLMSIKRKLFANKKDSVNYIEVDEQSKSNNSNSGAISKTESQIRDFDEYLKVTDYSDRYNQKINESKNRTGQEVQENNNERDI